MALKFLHPFLLPLLPLFVVFGSVEVEATPINAFGADSGINRLSIHFSRISKANPILPEKLSARMQPGGIQWRYLPGAYVSIPLITFEIQGLTVDGKTPYTVLLERMGA